MDCYEILALGRHTQYYYPTCTTFGFATLLLAKIKHSIRFGCVLALFQQLMESSAGRASGGIHAAQPAVRMCLINIQQTEQLNSIVVEKAGGTDDIVRPVEKPHGE